MISISWSCSSPLLGGGRRDERGSLVSKKKEKKKRQKTRRVAHIEKDRPIGRRIVVIIQPALRSLSLSPSQRCDNKKRESEEKKTTFLSRCGLRYEVRLTCPRRIPHCGLSTACEGSRRPSGIGRSKDERVTNLWACKRRLLPVVEELCLCCRPGDRLGLGDQLLGQPASWYEHVGVLARQHPVRFGFPSNNRK